MVLNSTFKRHENLLKLIHTKKYVYIILLYLHSTSRVFITAVLEQCDEKECTQ